MILLINTADSEDIFIGLIDKGGFKAQKKFKARCKQAEKLLPEIDKLVKSSKKKLKAIAAVSGPGSFTALRIGVVTANALAYSFKIPAVGISLKEFKDQENLWRIIKQKISQAKPKNIIKPLYGKKPNITKK